MKIMHILSYCLFALSSTTMIVLFVWGFLLPPTGVIDQSVIQASGELLALATIVQVPHIIRTIGENKNIKIQNGRTTMEFTHNSKE